MIVVKVKVKDTVDCCGENHISSSVPRPLSVPSELTAAGRAVRKMTQLKGREGEYCFFGIPQFNIDIQNMKIESGTALETER